MICVNKVWKLIGNNYDVTRKPEKEDILNLVLVLTIDVYGDQFLSTLIIVSFC